MKKNQKTQKKKKHERLSVEELIADKPWAYVVTAMPASVQRNTIAALEAFDKENPSRTVYENEKWREPFKAVLDFMDAVGYFGKEHDREGFYDDLLPSGYRVLEDVEYHKDEKMDRFIGGMIDDALMMLDSYRDPNMEEKTKYMLWLRGKGALWNIARHCIEGEEQKEIVKQSFDRLRELYPYKWKFLEREVEGIMDRPQEYMDGIRSAELY